VGIWGNIKCSNCGYSFTGGYQRSGTLDNFTNWGSESLDCPECKQVNLCNRKPFHKMDKLEKGWTLFVMSFHVLFYGFGIIVGGMAALVALANYLDVDNVPEWVGVGATALVIISLLVGAGFYGYSYVKDFFEDDKYL
jgi:hypothetical protein